MRKMQKQQAEDFVKLLGQAHGEIKKNIEKKQYPAALELLAQCQQGAIEVGNLIESSEGEDVSTISLLTEYCELVYQIYEKLQQSGYADIVWIDKKLRKALLAVENSIKNDIPLRKEIVFLPYKASMWDSLESVWRAADADANCDAYVIPIPYYDKNPDGSLGELHYEGAQYPKDVPVIWYKNYDLASRKPDVIFIHNPYDECNYVTSVHPDFYSSKLKNDTEKLVYIPYFVLGEINPENQEALQNIRHFCLAPAVLHAHKVIVQSENMRQAYINVLTESYGEHTKKYWQDKILGLGSPKLDKAAKTKREDVEIPPSWLPLIQKPDGSYKKVIFYNTSITALLNYEDKMLRKMQDVFRIFKENRENVALLWRPHPLIQATIESMRPQLWKEYERLVREYRAEGWGIYDDTADLNRAIALSDGYYGDSSSVVQLCREAGKPVLIQDVEILD